MSPVSPHPLVTSLEGARGRIESEMPADHTGELNVLVEFENGERHLVPAESLILLHDGNFQLTLSLDELSRTHTRPTVAARPADFDLKLAEHGLPSREPEPEPALAVPTIDAHLPPEPALDVPDFPMPATDLPEAPAADIDHVHLSRVVESYREDIGATLLREDVEIHRVPVNEYVEAAPPIRYEDDRIIIPVLEEVLQVEKRLMVREEVVVTKRRDQVTAERRVLRQETAVVAAPAGENEAAAPSEAYRRHYDAQRYPGARGFAYYEPAYQFGDLLRTTARYQGWPWEQLEPEARALWERDNPDTWTLIKPAVQFAWSRTAAQT